MNKKNIINEEKKIKQELINEVFSLLDEYAFIEEYSKEEEKTIYIKPINDFYVILNHNCKKDKDITKHYFDLYISETKNHSMSGFYISFFNRPTYFNYVDKIDKFVRDAHKKCFMYLMNTNQNYNYVNNFLHEYAKMEKLFLKELNKGKYIGIFPNLQK